MHIKRDINQFMEILPEHGRLLAIDPGSKSLGLAICDANRTIASPMETIWRGKFRSDAEKIHNIIQDMCVVGLVIGYPLNMDGSQGPRCQSAKQLAHNLYQYMKEKQSIIPILLWDERLSSCAVERAMISADLSRNKRHKIIDKLAASYILQGVLDAIK